MTLSLLSFSVFLFKLILKILLKFRPQDNACEGDSGSPVVRAFEGTARLVYFLSIWLLVPLSGSVWPDCAILKFFARFFLTKVAQIIKFLGYFEKPHSYVKTAVATSWVTFGNIWATFYCIWSHWSRTILKNMPP